MRLLDSGLAYLMRGCITELVHCLWLDYFVDKLWKNVCSVEASQ